MSALEEWYDEAMLVRRTKKTKGRIWGKKIKEIKEIRRLKVMESFERDGSNFVCNALRDRKPVQRTESRKERRVGEI